MRDGLADLQEDVSGVVAWRGRSLAIATQIEIGAIGTLFG